MTNSDNQNRFIKGTVSKQGFVRTSLSAVRSIQTQSEKVIFSAGKDDSAATAFTTATAATIKTAAATAYTAYKTAYITHKTNYAVGDKVIKGVSGGIKFIANPIMSDEQTYRKHLKTRVVRRVKNLKPVRAFTMTTNGVKTAAGAVKKTFRVTKAIKSGEIKVTKELVAHAGISAVKNVGKGTVSLAKTSGKTALRGMKTGVKYVPKTASAVGTALSSTGNEYLSAIGTTIKATEVTATTGIKTAQVAVKGTTSAIKTGYNGAKKIATATSYVRRNGIKKGAQQLGKKAVNKAGKSALNLVKNLFSFVARIVVAPSALIVTMAIVMAGATIAAVAGGAMSVIMGEETSVVIDVMEEIDETINGEQNIETAPPTTDQSAESKAEKKTTTKSVDEEEWLIERIKETKAEKVDEIKKIMDDDLIDNGGKYHEIRFYNSFADVLVPLEDEKESTIERTLYSDEQLYEIIQPVFHNLLLVKYDLKPTEKEMEKLYDEIVGDMMIIKSAENTDENQWVEFCNDETHYAIDVSESEANNVHTACHINHADGCNHVLAGDSCLNDDKGYHADDDFVNGNGCETCCYDYYTCLGHKGDLKCGITEHEHECDIDEAADHFIDMWNAGETISTGDTHGNWKLADFDVEETNGKKKLNSVTMVCQYTGTQDCEGHSHSEWNSKDDPGCYETKYHNDPDNSDSYSNSDPNVELHFQCDGAEHHSKCRGYRYCKGHMIEKIYFKSVDVDYLIKKYYGNEIDKLTKKKENGTATDEDLSALSKYIENKKLVEEMTSNLANRYGSKDVDIDKKELENIKITDNHVIIAYACVTNKVPYVVGGNDLSSGVDDIGLVCGAFSDKGFKHTYKGIAEGCEIIKDKDEKIKQGDIIFYSYDDKTDSIYHVGVALNDEYMVHASNTGTVRVSRIYRAAVHMVGRVS